MNINLQPHQLGFIDIDYFLHLKNQYLEFFAFVDTLDVENKNALLELLSTMDTILQKVTNLEADALFNIS